MRVRTRNDGNDDGNGGGGGYDDDYAWDHRMCEGRAESDGRMELKASHAQHAGACICESSG